MTYSYTQISQYLSCPRRYKHRYLDGWKEKDTRAAMLFGRAFEQALAAYFLREDPAAVLEVLPRGTGVALAGCSAGAACNRPSASSELHRPMASGMSRVPFPSSARSEATSSP